MKNAKHCVLRCNHDFLDLYLDLTHRFRDFSFGAINARNIVVFFPSINQRCNVFKAPIFLNFKFEFEFEIRQIHVNFRD